MYTALTIYTILTLHYSWYSTITLTALQLAYLQGIALKLYFLASFTKIKITWEVLTRETIHHTHRNQS